MGPLLFNLAVISLPSVVSSSAASQFADDTNQLRVSSRTQSLETHISELQRDANSCVTWANQASAVFNPTKSMQMSFGSKLRKSSGPHDITICDVVLSRANTHRHLGITLSSNLEFHAHVRNITHLYRSRVFLLRHMADLLPFTTISLLYKSYIRPTIEYALLVWLLSLISSECAYLDVLVYKQLHAARAYLLAKTGSKPE